MIKWLHISDLHLGDEDVSSLQMRDKLPGFLKEMGKFDYIFLTGDIRSANVDPNDFTREMADYILDICNACEVSPDHLFIVSGNHDVNRDAEGRHEVIQNVSFDWKGYYKPKKGIINQEDLQTIWTGQCEFRKFLSWVFPSDRQSLYNNPNEPHFNIETEHFNVLHLDTTVVYTKKQEAHDLIVGTQLLYKLLRSINPQKPTILLTHYPITSLLQDEKKKVGVILHEFGVRLWLAGHEHDQVLQHIGYLDMLQAGELKYEDDACASVLIGEYDPQTFRCNVSAYRWFDEGWAKYPYVDLDAEQKDIFSFNLKPLSERETPGLLLKTKKANEIALTRLPENLDSRLFPNLKSEMPTKSIQKLLSACWDSKSPNLILLGDGGMGKSTLLLDLCVHSKVPTLYVSAERISNMNLEIKSYCIRSLFEGDKERFGKILNNHGKDPELRIIVDGLNEVSASNERKLINEIQQLQVDKGIQLIVASRVDFTRRYNLYGFVKVYTSALEDETLQDVFTEEEWDNIISSPNLYRLMRNPMLVTIFKDTGSIMQDYKSEGIIDWKLPVENASDLFHNYYLAHIVLMMKRVGISGKKILEAMVCINQILPAIAYYYEVSYCINKLTNQFRDILRDCLNEISVDEDSLADMREFYREYEPVDLTQGAVMEMLLEELHLINREQGMITFPHQMYRDYLSAKHIINQSLHQHRIFNLWNTRRLPLPIGKHIRHLSGNYWNNIALIVKQEAVSSSEDTHLLIKNLFRCFPSDAIGGIADYSDLNLEDIMLPNLLPFDALVPLKNARINYFSLGLLQKMPLRIHVLKLSYDNRFLASVAGSELKIYSLQENGAPFSYDIGKHASQCIFYNDFLLINVGTVVVFKNDPSWRFIGEIRPLVENGFNSNLKSITGTDENILFHYSDRVIGYNLNNCSLAYDQLKEYDRNDNSDGIILTALRRSIDINAVSKITSPDIPTARSSNKGFNAKAFIDGRIEIREGEESVAVLGDSVPILQSASISYDGKFIVTLSGITFREHRRIIIWDVDNRIKRSEIFCESGITEIFLSDNGRWILGRNKNRIWIYNIESKTSRYEEDQFVSSQYGKLTTYGDNLLRRNADGTIEYYNLETRVSKAVKCPIKNPKLVYPLNSGTLAAVTKNGRTLQLFSERTGKKMSISPDYCRIIGIQTFKQKPFIAVTDHTNTVSIYHTGTGQRTRILDNSYHINRIAVHPQKTYIAHTDNQKNLSIESFHDRVGYRKLLGQWKRQRVKQSLESNILDFAFNEKEECLILVLANGTILYLDETTGEYRYSTYIVTAINTEAYDFDGVICSDDIKEIIRSNTPKK